MNEYSASPCVGSGLCCKTAPCGYGVWDSERHQCVYLELSYKDEAKDLEIFRCGKYEEIKVMPGAEFMPAFGTGCCMGLFNRERNKIIKEINTELTSGSNKLIKILHLDE